MMELRLTRNQIRAARALTDALVHDQLERLVEIAPARLAARVQPLAIRVAQERDPEPVYHNHNNIPSANSIQPAANNNKPK